MDMGMKSHVYIEDLFFRHIKEHLKDSMDIDIDQASPEELDFHFFK